MDALWSSRNPEMSSKWQRSADSIGVSHHLIGQKGEASPKLMQANVLRLSTEMNKLIVLFQTNIKNMYVQTIIQC